MSLPRPTGPVVAFGRYRLLQDPVRLVADGAPVDIGARALDVLAALVEAQGRPVAHATLAQRAWSGAAIDANTVQAQISALRRALGADRDLIVTMPGYGYRFAAPLHTPDDTSPVADATTPDADTPPRPAAEASHPVATWRMPVRATPFVGRHAELSELLGLASTTRIVTLTGAPGLGKRRLAHEVARRLAAYAPDGSCAVALTPQRQPSYDTLADTLADTVALALNAPAEPGATTLERLLAAIGPRRLLMIVDCGEPLREAAASLIGTLVDASPNLRVIVTAQHPLQLEREGVVPLEALRAPQQMPVHAADALGFDALRLLFARLAVLFESSGRVSTRRSHAVPDALIAFDTARTAPETLAAAASIARRLDGVPLALELAAAAIARRASTQMPLDMAIRTCAHELAMPAARRAETTPIDAVLDLHLHALDENDRTHFRRLAIFPGEFTRDAAVRLLMELDAQSLSCCTHNPHDASSGKPARAFYDAQIDTLLDAGLVEQFDAGDDTTLRLHDQIRRFARERLWQHGEFERAAAVHAHALVARLASNARRSGRVARDAIDLALLDDLRAALEWTLQGERIDVAIALLGESDRLWHALSLDHEYLRAIRAALARIDASVPRRMRDEMRLSITLARALPGAHAPLDEIIAAWQAAYDLANACADSVGRQHALAGLIASFAKARDGDASAAPEASRRDDRTEAPRTETASGLAGQH